MATTGPPNTSPDSAKPRFEVGIIAPRSVAGVDELEEQIAAALEAGQRLDRRKPPHAQRGLYAAILAQDSSSQSRMTIAPMRRVAVLQPTNNMIESLERTS